VTRWRKGASSCSAPYPAVRFSFPPRISEPGSGDTDLEWIEASGMGTVYSMTVVSQKPPAPPYNVVLVDLDEGARLMSRVDGAAPDSLRIGMGFARRSFRRAGRQTSFPLWILRSRTGMAGPCRARRQSFWAAWLRYERALEGL
jgi:hypothetical protein